MDPIEPTESQSIESKNNNTETEEQPVSNLIEPISPIQPSEAMGNRSASGNQLEDLIVEQKAIEPEVIFDKSTENIPRQDEEASNKPEPEHPQEHSQEHKQGETASELEHVSAVPEQPNQPPARAVGSETGEPKKSLETLQESDSKEHEVSSTTNTNSNNPNNRGQRGYSRRHQGRHYVTGSYQNNYGLLHLPYKSNFEPSEAARRRADEFLKTLNV